MDIDLSDHSSLEGLRADHPGFTTPALWVVDHLHVLEHLSPRGIPGLESLAMDRFDLEAVKETLGAGIAVTVAFATHAALEVVPVSSDWYRVEEYWPPRSECTTTLRENRSISTAK